MKTAYVLWRKPTANDSYERVGQQYPDLASAMTTAGFADPADWTWANSEQINMVPTEAAYSRRDDLTQWLLAPEQVAENDADRVELATSIALEYGQLDGAHHKSWAIDQMLRVLTGDRYDEVIADYCNGEDGPDTYEWDEGIAP